MFDEQPSVDNDLIDDTDSIGTRSTLWKGLGI